MRIKDFYDDASDFEVELSTAIHNAKTEWEQRFCTDLYNRYMVHGNDLFLTANSVKKLAELQVVYEDRKIK